MLGLQLNLPSFITGSKPHSVQYSVQEILRIYKEQAEKISLDLKKYNAAYDFYQETLFIWLVIDSAKLEKKALNLQSRINKQIASSGIKIDTTVMNDWPDLPLPDGYSSLIES